MTLKKCIECGKEVSIDAKFCTHCGKPTKTASAYVNTAASKSSIETLAWVLVGVIVLGMYSCSGKDKLSSTPVFDPAATVRGLCMFDIKSQLHDPASASFEHSSSTIASKNGDIWTVQRPVSAKNAFNATRRSMFECKYLQSGQNFSLIAVRPLSK